MRAIHSLVWAGLLAGQALAATIDQTCATCGRRALDSANMIIDPVRVNQVGYRNDDPHKRAYVGSPKSTTFSVTITYTNFLWANDASATYPTELLNT